MRQEDTQPVRVKRMSAPHFGWGLLALSLLLIALGFGVGSQGLDWQSASAMAHIRIPRTLGAWTVGMLLGLAGCVAQAMLRNPLADPYLLGSASGAMLAYAVALVGLTLGLGWGEESSWNTWVLTMAAFLGAMLAVWMALVLAQGAHNTVHLILAGVVVGVVCSALASLLAVRYPSILPSMQDFALGQTGLLDGASVLRLMVVCALCLLVVWLLGPRLDALVLGESSAQSLGVAVVQLRWVLLAVISLATAVSVAHTGLIAFVGLVAANAVQQTVWVRQRGWVLCSALLGGVLLLAADVLARWVIAPQELPVGVLTALGGGAYLLLRLWRRS